MVAATAESSEVERPKQSALVKLSRFPVYWLFHSTRLFGYFFVLPPALAKFPKQTLATLVSYAVVHRQRWWQQAVHRFFSYGASARHRIVNPSEHLIKDDQRYLWTIHPHSILADGWHSIIARNQESFGERTVPKLGRNIALCFAPIIRHVPVHQEMYRDSCGDADKKSITNWWKEDSNTDPALIPGGFAEAVFSNAADTKYEYSYLKDRKGFIRICLEERKDIIPMYTFRSTRMYWNPGILRGWRARFSQHYFLGLVMPMGKFGTAMPFTDKTTTVVFPPFPASQYSLEQLNEAHQAFLVHLKKYFDEYKGQYGMKDTELVFVGNDFVDDDPVARTLQSLGIMASGPKVAARSRL